MAILLSTYHLEAAIAYEHCASPSFDKTNWKLILNYYEMLCKISLSPATLLNKIAVVMQLHGPLVALQQLEEMNDNKKLETIYLYYSLLGELNLRLNRREDSKKNFEKAISLTQSPSEKALLSSKIAVMFN
ncbi:MAG: hypothetical protein IPP29_23315 [Bacteroidetes bacterium]|nr:hypothetical protein [Bacteroidota bacterium]